MGFCGLTLQPQYIFSVLHADIPITSRHMKEQPRACPVQMYACALRAAITCQDVGLGLVVGFHPVGVDDSEGMVVSHLVTVAQLVWWGKKSIIIITHPFSSHENWIHNIYILQTLFEE